MLRRRWRAARSRTCSAARRALRRVDTAVAARRHRARRARPAARPARRCCAARARGASALVPTCGARTTALRDGRAAGDGSARGAPVDRPRSRSWTSARRPRRAACSRSSTRDYVGGARSCRAPARRSTRPQPALAAAGPRHRHARAATRCSAPPTRPGVAEIMAAVGAPGRAPRAAAADAARRLHARRGDRRRARRRSTSSASARPAPTRSTARTRRAAGRDVHRRGGRRSTIHGVDVAPGWAQGQLVNAARLAGADRGRAARRPSRRRPPRGARASSTRTRSRGSAGQARRCAAIVRDFDDDKLAEHARAAAAHRRGGRRRPRRGARLEVDGRRSSTRTCSATSSAFPQVVERRRARAARRGPRAGAHRRPRRHRRLRC